MPEIPATQQAEIKKTTFKASQGKVSETSISTNKLGVMVYICNPSYMGDHR
jgi:hypothetical protein